MSRIVFVEDDPDVGQLIAAYLGKHDIDVTLSRAAILLLTPSFG